ncbi:MAG: mechanosensitive ion channel [Moraxella sp.]|nr:mechanosensitive ion channel [Moraxella sp.]
MPQVPPIVNHYLTSPIGSVIGAILIFLVGYFAALILGSFTKKSLAGIHLNQKINAQTGKNYDLQGLISKIVFWFVFIIAVSASLNQLNLNAISAPFANMVNQVLSFVPNLLAVVAIGLIGWVLAIIAKNATLTALSKTSLDDKLAQEVSVKPMSNTIADMVYWLILLVVLTVVLGRLGLNGLFAPLANMMDKIFAFIPNIFIAGVIFFVGFVVAKLVKGIVSGLVQSLNIQALATKAGISEKNSLPNIAGSLVFLVIIIPFTIASLDALKIEAISRPATNMLDEILTTLPNIFTAVAILVVTYFVVRMIADIIKGLLQSTQVDSLPAKLGVQDALGEQKVSGLVRCGIIFFAMLLASVAAADVLGFAQISDIVSTFIHFGGQVILGAVILVIGFWLAGVVAGVVERSQQGSKYLANIVRMLIIGLVLAMGLRAMGIADSIVNLAFGLTLGSVAVAFALAFGLGGREAAARYLAHLQDKLDIKNDKTANPNSDDTQK